MEKKGFKVPHTYVILVALVLICAIATWLVPAGAYDRVVNEATGRSVVDPDSFHFVENEGGMHPFDVMKEFVLGM